MTTTDVFQGINEGANSSSRVLRPPGGGSSDIFGTGSAAHTLTAKEEQKQNAQRAASGSNIFGGATVQPEDQPGVKHINRKQQASSQEAIFGDSPSGGDNKKRNQEGTYNPITGQLVGSNTKAEPQKNSSRVLNPPGGKSSGIW